ncbi:unnamed protein product [Paramecium pentaurelia]|uniref:Protein kinase domain-containing protein n=1 Tax=Paramecium pentaurelia TaxID=43138 RepID=A0A8S1XSF4_9CILI|nr:unnamed protein product [Paramecium pentaurelia]
MLNNFDELHILRLPKIVNTFAKDEFLQLSMKVSKINEYGNKHTRYFVLTNKKILLLNKSTIRRKVLLSFIIGITISSKSFEFILHFKNEYDDDDLRLQTESRSRLIEFIVKTYALEFHIPLASYQVQDLNLKKYVVYKQDRHKHICKLPNVKANFLNYKPILEEQENFLKMQQIYQQDTESKLLFGEFLLQLKDFELKKILCEGSISQIVQIMNSKTHTYHIMKCIKKEDHSQLNLNEFVTFKKYSLHPFLIPLEYCFETFDRYYFIMPQAKCDLYKKLDELKKFDQKQLLFIAQELVVALGDLHNKQIIHGDLTLENVLLDQSYHIALCDFGYLRRASKRKDEFYGVAEYTPPETIQNKDYQYYSDYWQLGIILYEMAYGHPPFIDYDQNLTFDYILNCQLEFPIQIEVDPQLKDLLSKLLCKEPTKRIGYQMGISEIQDHEYFKNTNWKLVYDRQLQPPEFEKKLKLF